LFFNAVLTFRRSRASRAFQRSYWPDVLRTDSVLNRGVRKDILIVTKTMSFLGILIALAGVITPLGLYETLLPSNDIQTPFQYLADSSSFGYATPPRSNYTFNRMCGSGDPLLGAIKPCPFSDTVSTVTSFPNGNISYEYPYGVNLSIPQVIWDTYSSGTNNQTTISNYFDIQWRRYTTYSDSLFNNGSAYLIGTYRSYDTLILNDAVWRYLARRFAFHRTGNCLRGHEPDDRLHIPVEPKLFRWLDECRLD
jgi:hypothetical protein